MNTSLYISFLLVSFGLIAIPGPNVIVIVSTSIAHGRERGLQTVAGTSLAMAIQLFVTAVCTSSFIQLMAEGFSILKWAGVAYLLYLGIRHFMQALSPPNKINEVSPSSTFYRGFLVSLSNPKTLLFFSAFLPQFISSADHYLQQMSILASSFLLMAVILDSCYALLASRIIASLRKHEMAKIQHIFSGLLYLAASTWLAVTRRA